MNVHHVHDLHACHLRVRPLLMPFSTVHPVPDEPLRAWQGTEPLCSSLANQQVTTCSRHPNLMNYREIVAVSPTEPRLSPPLLIITS